MNKKEPGPNKQGTVYLTKEEPAVALASRLTLKFQSILTFHGRTIQAAFTTVKCSLDGFQKP